VARAVDAKLDGVRAHISSSSITVVQLVRSAAIALERLGHTIAA
jgi:hypothetical protein